MSYQNSSRLIIPFALAMSMVVLLVGIVMAENASENISCAVPGSHSTIQAAIDDPVCEAINVGAGTFYETLTTGRSVTVQGSGHDSTTVNGFGGGSVFTMGDEQSLITVTLSSMSITDGSGGSGGGISALNTTLIITDCLIYDNYAAGLGGGIYADAGTTLVSDSSISGNQAGTGGGVYVRSGIFNLVDGAITGNESGHHGGGMYSNGVVLITGSSVDDNTTYVDGGGIFNHDSMTIYNSSISGNTSTNYSGGAVRNEGSLFIVNSTISSNYAYLGGGGIDNWNGTLRLRSSTVTLNYGNHGGGVTDYGSNIRLQNSIVAGNTGGYGPDCRDTVHSDGYNLIGDTSGCDFREINGDLLNVPVRLGAIEGDPSYHPLLPGPGINAGDPGGCYDHLGQLLDSDQRGMPRVGRCDIGSYEYQGEYHQTFIPICTLNFCADFFDDFSNPMSGWEVGEDSHVRVRYVSGEYQVQSKVSGYFYLFQAPSCDREQYITQVDTKWVGPIGSGLGIFFAMSSNFQQYYLFDINTDYQMFRLLHRTQSGWQTIVEPTSTGAIHSGNATNQLKVIGEAQKTTLEINGVSVRVLYSSLFNGFTGAGIVSSPYSNRPVSDARFDNFAMYALSGGETGDGTVLDGSTATTSQHLGSFTDEPVIELPPWPMESYG